MYVFVIMAHLPVLYLTGGRYLVYFVPLVPAVIGFSAETWPKITWVYSPMANGGPRQPVFPLVCTVHYCTVLYQKPNYQLDAETYVDQVTTH